jgi:hypothetical protein
VYDKVVRSHGDFMKQVSETADKLFADIGKYDQEMKDTFEPIYESMENGTYSDADILSFQDQLSGFRDEWKLIPKGKSGDDARLLWKSKVGKFKNDVVSMNQTLTNLSYIVANEEHIALDNPEDAQFLSAIGRLHSGEEGLKATKTIKDGRIVYQVNINGKVIEKNQDDIKKLVSPKDYTAISNLETQLDLAKQMPSSGYTTYDGDGAAYIARNIYNSIKSAGNGKSRLDAYRTLANYRYAGGKTFREAIYQDDLLSSVLSTSLLTANLPDKFDVSGPDGKPDGKVDKTDLLNKENYNALASYILKTPDVGGQLLANWYAASEGSKIFDRANKAYQAKLAKQNKGKDSDTGLDFYSKGKGVMLNNRQIITGSSAESLYTAIRDGIEFEEVDPLTNRLNKYSYKTIDGVSGWYENYEEGDTPKSDQFIGSASDLAAIFTKDSRFRNLQTIVEERVNLPGVTKSQDTRIEGDYSTNIRTIDINTMSLDDNNVADAINKFLPSIRNKSNPKGYVFYTTQMGRSEGISFERGGGDFGKESVTLYQLADREDKNSFIGPNGYRIKPVVVNGKVIEIKTGGSLQRRRKAIEDLDALFSIPEFNNLMLEKPRIN